MRNGSRNSHASLEDEVRTAFGQLGLNAAEVKADNFADTVAAW